MNKLTFKCICTLQRLYACKLSLMLVFFDFLLTVKAAPHECVIRTGLP